jgi:predicted metal-dependent phosphoesterase TrpH
MLADFHIHTYYSKGEILSFDALFSPKENVRRAKKVGLDCIAITDHNTTKGVEEAKKEGKKIGVKVVEGIELSIKYGNKWWQKYDLILLGEKIDLRTLKGDLIEVMEKAKAENLITYAPHPFTYYGINHFIKSKYVDVVETFNSNASPLANLRAELAARKYKKTKVAGSDSHILETIGNVANKLYLDEPLESLRKGKVEIVRKRSTNVMQFKKHQLERFKKVEKEARNYLLKRFPEDVEKYRLKIFASLARNLAIGLLDSTLQNKILPQIFWNLLIPLIYVEDFGANFLGLIYDVLK